MIHFLTRPIRSAGQIVLALALVGLVFAVLVKASLSWPISAYEIPAERIEFAEAETVSRPNRFLTRPDAKPLRAQAWHRQDAPRRFHMVVDLEMAEMPPSSLYIPHLGKEAQVFFNGASLGPGQRQAFRGFGWGVSSFRYDLSRFQLLPGPNRIDIYVENDPTRAGLGPVYFGPTEIVSKAAARQAGMGSVSVRFHLGLTVLALALNLIALSLAPGRRRIYLILLAVAGYGALGLTLTPLPAAMVLAGLGGLAWIMFRNAQLTGLWTVGLGLGMVGPLLILWRGLAPLPGLDPGLGFWLVLIGPVLVLVGWPLSFIIRQIVTRRSRVEVLKSQLDDTQSVLEAEIRRRAVFEERERLTRDIHDGVGGQLLGLLLRLRTGELPRETIARDLQAGLNDLRLVVDALDHTGNDLGRALNAFQDRADNSLDAAGLSLNWSQAERLDYSPRNQNTVLNLYRFLQEALNNVIAHAQASHVEVEVYSEEDALVVTVRDDGIGRSETAVPGRGTLNMQRRAELLDGSLTRIDGLNGRGHGLMLRLAKSSEKVGS